MDTPGLLDRPAEKRNEMEELTFASIAYLPTKVVFVIDASGSAGSVCATVIEWMSLSECTYCSAVCNSGLLFRAESSESSSMLLLSKPVIH
jgi:hypothetical protein